jgi:hypothetical protein
MGDHIDMNGSTSRILAFDPGEMVGIALIEDGDFLWGMTCKAKNFDRHPFILSLTKMTNPTAIILETPPTQTPHFSKDQVHVYELLKSYYEIAGYNVYCITPGMWKGLVERTKIDVTHVRDAADMAQLHYRKERKSGT